MLRHKWSQDSAGNAACDCGYNPQIIASEKLDWGDQAYLVLAHIKKSRRWKYQGVEVHYGYRYYLWQQELTGRKFAWPAEAYRAALGGQAIGSN